VDIIRNMSIDGRLTKDPPMDFPAPAYAFYPSAPRIGNHQPRDYNAPAPTIHPGHRGFIYVQVSCSLKLT